jgi:hypothetical protein
VQPGCVPDQHARRPAAAHYLLGCVADGHTHCVLQR